MRLSNDSIDLWYATPDAPAPHSGETVPRDHVSVTVGVRPANPSNTVRINYSVDGTAEQAVSAVLDHTDYQAGTQYFRADFPTFWSGEVVRYVPVAVCGGRRVPDPTTTTTYQSDFRLGLPVSPLRTVPPTERQAQPGAAVFVPVLEHLVHVHAALTPQPELVGQTPFGYIVNWPPLGGTLDGPAFHARVIPGGEHQAVIVTEGLATLTSSVTVQTLDNALIGLRHNGVVDYGRDWAERLTSGRWPAVLPIKKSVRMLTAHPRYAWLNQLQCVGIGEVHPLQAEYVYDIYAVR